MGSVHCLVNSLLQAMVPSLSNNCLMKSSIKTRLTTIFHNVSLLERLQKVALVDDSMLDKLQAKAARSVQNVTNLFIKEASRYAENEEENPKLQHAVKFLSRQAKRLHTNGQIDGQFLLKMRDSEDLLWKSLSKLAKGSKSFTYLFTSFSKLLDVLELAAKAQEPELLQQAKDGQEGRDRIAEILGDLVGKTPVVKKWLDRALQDVPESVSSDELTEVNEQVSPTFGRDVADAARTVMKASINMSFNLSQKAQEMFGTEVVEQLQNIYADIFTYETQAGVHKLHANLDLNKDKNFYSKVLEMQSRHDSFDLRKWLSSPGTMSTSQDRKSFYVAYRSFIMMVRATGVLQYVATNFEKLKTNPRVKDLAIKASQIANSRATHVKTILTALNPSSQKEDSSIRPEGLDTNKVRGPGSSRKIPQTRQNLPRVPTGQRPRAPRVNPEDLRPAHS